MSARKMLTPGDAKGRCLAGSVRYSRKEMARRKGFEPLTPRFEVRDTLFILLKPA
jgi:hypothetical protein